MTTITYFGVTTETGGGKRPIRKRHNQNYKLYSSYYTEEKFLSLGRTYALEYLKFRTDGKVIGNALTRIKINDKYLT